MRLKALMKDSIKEIRKTFKRFLSILLIVLLGVGFFAGIKATSPDMEKTIDEYFDKNNVFDLEVISTLGINKDDIDIVKNVDGIENIVGTYSKDAIINIDNTDIVVKLHSITEKINNVVILEGKMPENINECVVEKKFLESTNHRIGDYINIQADDYEDESGNIVPFLKEDKVRIVGTIKSPLYLSVERGSTKLGSGKINYYIYIPEDNINQNIYTELYITVNGTKGISSFCKKYENLVENISTKLEELGKLRKEERYKEIIDNTNNKLNDLENTLEKEKIEAESKIKEAENKIKNAKKELENAKSKLSKNKKNASTQFKNAKKKILDAQKEIDTNEKTLNKKITEANINITKLKNNLSDLNVKLNTINNSLENIKTNISTLNLNKEQLNVNINDLTNILYQETNAAEIANIENQINNINTEIQEVDNKLNELNTNRIKLENSKNTVKNNISIINTNIKKIEFEIENGKEKLNLAKIQLNKEKNNLNVAKKKMDSEFNSAENKIITAENEIIKNETKLQAEKVNYENKILEAEEKLDDARQKVKDLKKPEWYILSRDENQGYISYKQDSQRIANIGKVFPVVFFVVAALICLNSMSRMVEEQRVQIGGLKAIGYNKIQIASKYIIYSLLATIFGSFIGMTIGFNLIPRIIINMYSLMYDLPEKVVEFDIKYAILGFSIALICTVGATIYSSIKLLNSTPAKLMRPKAPKIGKRVFLEKIKFIWTKLKFTQKVTVRNIFRYKKRFLMTIIGIAGCTSLIVAGFGLRDSISSMIPAQYGEIFKYKIEIQTKSNITNDELENIEKDILNDENVIGTLKVNLQAVTINNSNQNVQLMIIEPADNLSDFINLQSRKSKQKYELDDNSIIITEKIAKLLNIKIDDVIKIKNEYDSEVEVKVKGITENYLRHYIYMTPNLYKKLYKANIKYNLILANTLEMTEDEENMFSKELLKNDNVSGVTFMSIAKGIFQDIMDNMEFVVWILIISAGLLAFVVLYNLSNVNIGERIRELATIKVLGFYDKEIYRYINRETTILTIIGIIIGLICGYFLNLFIIQTCELDILMFDKKVKITSYICAILITTLFTLLVNIATYYTLKKIDMIESLKSVE